MKAISLWQPWASAMASGAKKNETRSWPISHRGDLLICSAKRKPTREEMADDALFAQAMTFPFGMALCVVEVFDCQSSGMFYVSSKTPRLHQYRITQEEWDLGDYSHGRYIWMTRGLRTFTRPFAVTGRQGLFEVLDEVIERETLMPVKHMTLSNLLLGL